MRTARVVITKKPVSAAFACPYCKRRYTWNYERYVSEYGNSAQSDVTCPFCKNVFKLDDTCVKET